MICRTCGESYPEFGDGWDGECPNCADLTYARDGRFTCQEHSVAGKPECPHVNTRPDPDSDERLCDDCGQRIFAP